MLEQLQSGLRARTSSIEHQGFGVTPISAVEGWVGEAPPVASSACLPSYPDRAETRSISREVI
jgi:hypothetical protein